MALKETNHVWAGYKRLQRRDIPREIAVAKTKDEFEARA
jgi:hypothetical protein